MNYPNPCDKCKRPCKNSNSQAKTCLDYRAYINAWWKFFNICYRRLCGYSHNENPEKFVYEHPDVYRRYIMASPCDKCKAKENCQTVCATYTKHLRESVWNIDPVAVCEGRPVGLAWCAAWYAIGLFIGLLIEILTGGADE